MFSEEPLVHPNHWNLFDFNSAAGANLHLGNSFLTLQIRKDITVMYGRLDLTYSNKFLKIIIFFLIQTTNDLNCLPI